jgi:hypothetical protein
MTRGRASTRVRLLLWPGLARAAVGLVAAPPAPPEAPPASNCPAIQAPLVVPFANTIGGIAFDPGCQYLYITNESQNRVEIYSLQTLALESPILVGAQPGGLAVTADGTLLYVPNSGGNNISVVSVPQRTELRRITVTDAGGVVLPYVIALADNGRALFATAKAGSSSGALKALDLSTDAVSARDDAGFGSVTGRMHLVASGDRQTIALAAGNSSAGAFFLYRAATDSFTAVKRMNATLRDVSSDFAGRTFLFTPGAWVNDDTIRMTGTIIGGSGWGGNAVDPTRGIGYRAIATRIDVLNLSTYLKVGERPLGASVSNAASYNRIGRMTLSPDGTLLAVITNTGFSVVRLLDEAPQRVNLVRNGSFGAGVAGWTTFATPDPSYVESDVTDGVFRFNRLAPPPGTSNQAVVFHETGLPLPSGAPIQARFDLGNTSSARKRISVLLIDADWSDLSVCTFWLPPNTPLSAYRMRTHTTKAWTNAAIYFYAATAGADGGHNLIDNVSLQYDPSFAGTTTECVDPFAPAQAGGLDGPEWLVNGDFSSGDTTGWTLYGTLTPRVFDGVFEFMRETDTPPAGVILQPTGQSLAAGEVLTAGFELGNSSPVRKRVTVLLHDRDFSDLSACTFWLEPGQALAAYEMRAFATRAWTDATLSVYAATVDTQPWARLDNAHLRRAPSAPTAGTVCLEPGALVLPAGAAVSTPRAPEARQAGRASAEPAGRGKAGTRVAATSAPEAPAVRSAASAVGSQILDLTAAAGAQLVVESWLQAGSRGEIQISLDGSAWRPLAAVGPSDGWVTITIDLDAWIGESIALRFVAGADDESTARAWALRNLKVLIRRQPPALR